MAEATTSEQTNILPPYKNAYVRRMIQHKAQHYFLVWEKMKLGKFKFHWPAMLFSNYWLLYRKMYFIFFGFWIADAVVLSVVLLISIWLPIILFAYIVARFILPGFYGHFAYQWHVRHKLDHITDEVTDEQERVARMMKDGGTSTLAVIVGIFFVPSVYAVVLSAFETWVL